MDLIDDGPPGQNAPEFSVSELSGLIKRMIEGEFSHVRIKEEVSRVSRPRSGHIYFDLKDDKAVLAAICWKGQAARLSTQPEEGMEVVATGRLTTFPGQSRYQIVVEELRVAGVGALMAMLEKRKKQLAAEGLFAPDRKIAIPYLPDVIGVVTSPSGAVIRDILTTLQRRFPRKVLVWPVAVQGEGSAAQVANAVTGFNALQADSEVPRPDLIIVARGGGSIEDLWGFNEEVVARAASASTIPLISAVGHETDTTLIDYISDRRAPTPTAAAEMAVPRRDELLASIASFDARRIRAMADRVGARRQRLRDLARALPKPHDILAQQTQRLDHLIGRLPQGLTGLITRARARLGTAVGGLRPAGLAQRISQRRDRLETLGAGLKRAQETGFQRRSDKLNALARLHETLGYQATLRRGYAVVRDGEGALLPSAKQARTVVSLEVEFHDGKVVAGAGSRQKKSRSSKADGPGQGELF
ncbi:MAG: exodeoxyribonuclease VII large subunit [Pseudomonadota bacterium]